MDSSEDALRALATILQNGTPDDWRALDRDALVSVLDDVPIFGHAAELLRPHGGVRLAVERRQLVAEAVKRDPFAAPTGLVHFLR